MPERCFGVSECLDIISPMTSIPYLFFSLIYEFKFHYIRENIGCLYVVPYMFFFYFIMFFPLIYEFKFHYIKEDIACLYVVH